MGPASSWTGVVLVALATLAGSGVAVRHADRREILLGAASGALLVIAGVHLLPDAWSQAPEAGLPTVAVPLAAVVAFALSGWLTRRGCTCADRREATDGVGATVALAGHRVLEGAALTVAGSATVVVALSAHAFAEGLAAGTLLTSVTRRWRRALVLAVLCLSPVAGVAVSHLAVPESLTPVLVAAAVGVLGQAARLGLAAAFSSRRVSPAAPAVALLAAGLVTTLAVWGVG